jgi:Tfp pilus assembly protein PilE
MKNLMLALTLLFIALSAYSQSIVRAEKNSTDADLCFYQQVQLKGYVYANLIGRCAWDPAMNGMTLSLVAVPEDVMEEAHKIELGYIRNVKLVQNKSQQLQISIILDNMKESGEVFQENKVTYVRAVDSKKATFSVLTR